MFIFVDGEEWKAKEEECEKERVEQECEKEKNA